MFRTRILLDLSAVGLIVVCLAYWWLDNLAHELIGTGLFALVIGHNVFNRRWYGAVPKGRHDAGRIFNIATIACLALAMLVLLATSLLISRDLFRFMALDGAFTLRTIHMFTGYWVLLIVAVHLGTRWGVVMNTCRATFGITGHSAWRAWLLRATAAIIAAKGFLASSEMAFGSKLMWQVSLDMWDFNERLSGFFVNYLTIVGLYAVLTHYAMTWLRQRRSGQRQGSRPLNTGTSIR